MPAIAGSITAAIALTGCGEMATGRITAPRAPKIAHWNGFAAAQRPLDVVGPRGDGSLVLAANRRLWLLSRAGSERPFPIAHSVYLSPGGEEPYVALAARGCFGAGTVYAIRLVSGRGIVLISASNGVRRFASLVSPGLIDGITFDRTGHFGHRLLVTITAGTSTTLQAINCQGRVATITRRAPRVEGGIAVAPSTFGRFAGDLIAPDEKSGRIYAITPKGVSALVADSELPHGPDVGVESEAFVPPGSGYSALVADRATPGNPHPGDDLVLTIRPAALTAAGVHGGDLLVATEGGGLTDDVNCTMVGCRVRLVAKGPAAAHVEGHIAFARVG